MTSHLSYQVDVISEAVNHFSGDHVIRPRVLEETDGNKIEAANYRARRFSYLSFFFRRQREIVNFRCVDVTSRHGRAEEGG